MLFIVLYARHRKTLFDYPIPDREYSVSIVVPCYNEEKHIGSTIKKLLQSSYPGLKKIIVVDDSSTDNSYSVIKEFARKYSRVLAVRTPRNTGCAGGAKNYGLKFVETELVGFTDADSFPNSNAVDRMVGYFNEKNVAAVTSRVLVKNRTKFLERTQDFDYHVIAWSRKVLDYIDSVYVTNGPLSIYRTGLIKKLGGFDIKNLTEDIEITWKLLSLGYQTRMSYSAKVYTQVPEKFKQWVNQRIRWNLGGLQTIVKYRNYLFRGGNFFGWFVIPYVSLAFFFSIIGIILLARYVWLKSSLYFATIPFLFRGYNPLSVMSFDIFITVLLIFGAIFLLLTLWYYKLAIKDSDLNKSILSILTYIFIYRPLYIIPLLLSGYKILKRDFRWYTK